MIPVAHSGCAWKQAAVSTRVIVGHSSVAWDFAGVLTVQFFGYGDHAASSVELSTTGGYSMRVMRHWTSVHHELPSINAKTEVHTVSPITSDNVTDSALTSWGPGGHRVEYVARSERRKREFEDAHVPPQLQ